MPRSAGVGETVRVSKTNIVLGVTMSLAHAEDWPTEQATLWSSVGWEAFTMPEVWELILLHSFITWQCTRHWASHGAVNMQSKHFSSCFMFWSRELTLCT